MTPADRTVIDGAHRGCLWTHPQGWTHGEPHRSNCTFPFCTIDGHKAATRAATLDAERARPAADTLAALREADRGYVLALRDHDECCGTLRNHPALAAAPTPEAPDTAAHLAWLREDDRLARALADVLAPPVKPAAGGFGEFAERVLAALEANR